jgi:hypothetical protein
MVSYFPTYNCDFVITVCHSHLYDVLTNAPILVTLTKLLEEMKAHGVKLKGETYICLLNALAATGRTDRV